jgi:DNA-binding response OmpR family regulator
MTNDDRSTILLAQPEGPARTFFADNLLADGYDILVADTAHDAIGRLETEFPDLTLIDMRLPDTSALGLLGHVRGADGIASRVDPHAPIVLFGGRDDELDCVRGFERGADDVVPAPVSYPELRCRIDVLLRRVDRRGRGGRIRVADLEIDTASRMVLLTGRPLDLSAKEFALLRVLAAEPTRVFTKGELLRTIWGQRTVGTTRTLDSHACRLRRKLGADGGRFVVNVWGVGYRLVDAPMVAPDLRQLLAVA